MLLAAGAAGAAEVRIFRGQSPGAFLAGTLDGISVDPEGILRLTDRVERVVGVQEPFVLAAARHPQGWVVGTGNAGRVLLVGRDGTTSELFAAPEPEIFALWVEPDGAVLAGSSPQGKVYRLAGGKSEVLFAPGETYIWGLARARDGALLVATGTQGKLFRVDGGGRGEVLFDSDDTHLRSLAVLPGGEILLGSAGEGLIVEIDEEGRARTVHDAPQAEIVAFAPAPDGGFYAAALAAEAGPPVKAPPGKEEPGERPSAEPKPVVSVLAEGEEEETPPGAPRPGYRGPRSEILRVSPGGTVESAWSFADETVYALLWHRDRLWVGTGLEGKLFSFDEGEMVLQKDVDERQVVALLADDPGPAFATTNAGALYRVTGAAERRGTYTSAALDAGQIARFGTFHWRGELPRGGGVRFAFRSGISGEPDRTWSSWTAARAGTEIALADVPPGRYLQWRAEFTADAEASPRLSGVEISYRHENLRPRVTRLQALDAGEILVPANFNPTNQVYEPAHPNREGIFTTLTPSPSGEEGRLKSLWKKGYRTLRWEADDANGDELRYRLSFRREEATEWLPMAEDLKEDHYSFDETALPDGVYRFRLLASDRQANAPAEALEAERVSEPVVVDNSPPALRSVRRDGSGLEVVVADAWSPLREATVSRDGGPWEPARPADGLLDGRQETLRVPAPAAGFVLLRAVDAAFNVITFDVSAAAR